MGVESVVPRVTGCEERKTNGRREFWVNFSNNGGGGASIRVEGADTDNAYVGHPHPEVVHKVALEGEFFSGMTGQPEHVIPLNGIRVIQHQLG